MRAIDAMHRSGLAVGPECTINNAAGVMERAGVGALAVIDGDELVGIVTDRDLVRRALAKAMAPDARVDAVMTTPVVTIDADSDLHDAFARFRTHAVPAGRRGTGEVRRDDHH